MVFEKLARLFSCHLAYRLRINFKKNNSSKKFKRPGNWPQNMAQSLKSDNIMTSKHRQVGWLAIGKGLEHRRLVLRFQFGRAKSPQCTLFGPFSLGTKFLYCRGFFIKICSPNFKSEHRTTTFQFLPLKTPNTPMFRHCEFFTFLRLGPIFGAN